MTKDELLSLHGQMTKQALDLMTRKNADYAPGDNALGNLLDSTVLGIAPEMGILIRMMDKIKRVSAFSINGTLAVSDESVTDTLTDLINYAVLCQAAINYQNLESVPKAQKRRTRESFSCLKCNAPAYKKCTTSDGNELTYYHKERRSAWETYKREMEAQ